MTSKSKVLIFFLLIFLILVLYLILTSESVKKIDNSGLSANNQTTPLSEENYKIKVKEIFTAYEKLLQDNNFTIEKITELKNELLALKGLPTKFKELHLKLILALDKMEDYLNSQDKQEKNASQQIDSQLKADYSWLNN